MSRAILLSFLMGNRLGLWDKDTIVVFTTDYKAKDGSAKEGSRWKTTDNHRCIFKIWNKHCLKFMDGPNPDNTKTLTRVSSYYLKRPKTDGKEDGIKTDANTPPPVPTTQKLAPKREGVHMGGPQQKTPKKTSFIDQVKSVVDRVKSVVKRRGTMIYMYGLLGLGALYGVYHYRDSIPFLAAKQPEKDKEPPTFFEKQKQKFEGYSTLQQVAGAGALLAGTVGAVVGCKRFRKPAPQEEESSRSICDSVCSESFWRTHGLKLGLGIIFLAGLVALVFCLPGSEQQNDWDCEEDLEWGP